VVDVAAGRVAAVLAGHREPASLAKQHCVEQNLVFSIESHVATALVFDLRTCKPAFVIPEVTETKPINLLSFDGDGAVGILGP
jgi:hypothetical protein